jgi:vacuolar iron transporter family protein
MPHSTSDHFQGKSVPEHLKEARLKGMQASAENHGTEISGMHAAFADSLRDTALAMALFATTLSHLLPEEQLTTILLLFLGGWALWKTCRSALLGWARLERLHRLIEEERWEIEHHRPQEREELMEMYQVKGFKGELLTEAIDVLMADDNRLLEVMLVEELGLSLESFEHPLKQAFGALLGSLTAIGFGVLALIFFSPFTILCVSLPLFLGASIWTAKIERIKVLPSLIWNLAVFMMIMGLIHFTQKLLIQ